MCRRHYTISLLTVYALVKGSTESVMAYSTIESKNPKNRKLFPIDKEGPKRGNFSSWRDLSFCAYIGLSIGKYGYFFSKKGRLFRYAPETKCCQKNRILLKSVTVS